MIKRYSVFFPFRWHKHAVSALRGLLFSAVSVAHLLSEGGGLNTGRKSEALASRVSLPPGGERGERGGGGDPGRPPFSSSSSQPGVTGRALSVLSGEATEGTNRNDDRALVGGEEEAG